MRSALESVFDRGEANGRVCALKLSGVAGATWHVYGSGPAASLKSWRARGLHDSVSATVSADRVSALILPLPPSRSVHGRMKARGITWLEFKIARAALPRNSPLRLSVISGSNRTRRSGLGERPFGCIWPRAQAAERATFASGIAASSAASSSSSGAGRRPALGRPSFVRNWGDGGEKIELTFEHVIMMNAGASASKQSGRRKERG